MDLTEALALSKKSPGTACAIGELLKELDADDARELRAALALPNAVVPHAQLIRALALMGKKVTANSVGRHRAGECRCEPV